MEEHNLISVLLLLEIFDFPLPPYKEQIRIVETVQRIFGQLDVITESL